MWKFVLAGLAIFVLYKMFMNDKGRKAESEQEQRKRKVATGQMVQDPICGTYVDVDESITVKDGTQTHRFCSYECRQKFLDTLAAQGREIPHTPREDD